MSFTICLPVVASGGISRASGRNMEQFTIHITVGPQSKATFQLTYEEVLKRRLKQYDIVIKVKPKQLVRHFEVDRRSQGRTSVSFPHHGSPHWLSVPPQAWEHREGTCSSRWVAVGCSWAENSLNLPTPSSSAKRGIPAVPRNISRITRDTECPGNVLTRKSWAAQWLSCGVQTCTSSLNKPFWSAYYVPGPVLRTGWALHTVGIQVMFRLLAETLCCAKRGLGTEFASMVQIDVDIFEPQGISKLDAQATFLPKELAAQTIKKSFSGKKVHGVTGDGGGSPRTWQPGPSARQV